jgi:uncharacterized protein YjbJ (UPF0337 family)
MNWERVEGNWNEFQGKMLQQWSKLTSDDLNQVKGRRDALLGKLQERYGFAREAAERQIDEWMRRVGDQAGAGMTAADNITGAYQDWFDRMTDAQRQSIELMSERMRKVMELPVRLAKCQNPVEVAKLQGEFISTLVSDYFEGARKMLGVLTDATQDFAQEQTEAVEQQVRKLKSRSTH